MTTTTYRYDLPSIKGEGWAIVFMDDTGVFSAITDWGNVGYRWTAAGFSYAGDFRKFILDCDDCYLTSKFGQGQKEMDNEETVNNVRRRILELRRNRSITRDVARHEWDLISEVTEECDFDASLWGRETGLDTVDIAIMKYPNDVTLFVEHVMPRLREILCTELGND